MIMKSPPQAQWAKGGQTQSICPDHEYDDQLHKSSILHMLKQSDGKVVLSGSRETSSSKANVINANPSFRVYYGEVSGSVPFTWESRPGTPKYTPNDFISDHNINSVMIPPLTPPPSSYSSFQCSSRATKKNKIKHPTRSKLLPTLFMRIHLKKKPNNLFPQPPSSPSSSSLSSSWSSHNSSFSAARAERRTPFSSRGSSFDHDWAARTGTTDTNPQTMFKFNSTGITTTLRAAGLCFGSSSRGIFRSSTTATAPSVVTIKKTPLSSILGRRGSETQYERTAKRGPPINQEGKEEDEKDL